VWQDYGRFAADLKRRGYQAIKLHTWMPPVSFAPSVEMDIKACAAVREAVGPGFPLMLDANHWYSRTQALTLGRAIQNLGYAWFEEPMEEASISSYVWMANQLDIPVIGPEVAWGKHFTRAEWIRAGACDILRTGVHDVGGLTPALKCVHLAESFNMDCEVHGTGAGNLTLCAVQPNGTWYERGLLHPHFDYDACPDYLLHPEDPIDAEGFVHLSDRPGLGQDVNWEWVKAHAVSTH
jgi:L-alanine-DL-glutamate epimerase-like enolase superfamily enzyme